MFANRSCAALAVFLSMALAPSTGSAADLDPGDPPFAIGRVACGEYLFDVAKDPSLQSLYDAWLAGYVTVAMQGFPSAPKLVEDSEMARARGWIGAYCHRRTSDTFLSATVRFLEMTQRDRFGENEPTPSGLRLANAN